MDRDRFKRKTDEGSVTPQRPVVRPAANGNHEITRPVKTTQITHLKPVHRVKTPPQPTPMPKPQPRQAVRPHIQPVPAPTAQTQENPAPRQETPPQSIPSRAVTGAPKYKKLSKKTIAAIALVVTVLIGAVVGSLILNPDSKPSADKATASMSDLHVSTGSGSSSKVDAAGTVPFTPVTPKDKPELGKLGGDAYNSQYKSYTFDDTLLGGKVRVSQQELPSGQDLAGGLIDKITSSLQAQSMQPVNLNNGQSAYLLNGTNRAGAQVAVFTVKSILVFVQSSTSRQAPEWADYLNSFQ